MADTLLIHFNIRSPGTARWALVNNAGELTTMISHGALSDAAATAEKHKAVVLIDNTPIHIDKVQLPIKNRAKLLRAIPFALEERIADEVDQLHFVAGKADEEGSVPVAAIRKDVLEDILSRLSEAGISPVAILPDTLCLTASENQWAILLHGEQANLQFDTLSGSEFDSDVLPAILMTILKKENTRIPEKIILFTLDGEPDDAIAQAITGILPQDTELVKVSYNQHPLVVYCGQYQNAMPLNLLQDEYKPQRKSAGEWQRWRLAAGLAVAWLVLGLGSAGAEYYKLQDKNKELSIQIEKIYKKTFPKSKKILDPQRQMEEKLNELKGNSSTGGVGMLTLLAESASALASEKDITLQTINFRNNTIDIELTGTNLQSIESVNKKINKQSLKSEITSSSSEKNNVKGNIRVEKVGP